MAVLLIDVLTGLGGASQEKSAARNFGSDLIRERGRQKCQSRFFIGLRK
jgi:hypothetical protein